MAGNADNLNAAIRRASPALRETDKVLATLGAQNRILGDLTVNADKVVGDLAANRKDVGRFVTEAKDTAQASAERRGDIAAGLQRAAGLPRAAAADDEGRSARWPTTRARRCATSTPRPSSSRPSSTSSARSPTPRGRPSGRWAGLEDRRPRGQGGAAGHRPARRLRAGTPELGKNLSIVLQHLDDRKHAVEKDPRSPGGQGYTGLEALLQYVYDQTTSTSIFDQNNHILKVGAFVGPCADYASEETLQEGPGPRAPVRLAPRARSSPASTTPTSPSARRRTAKDRGARKRADGDHDLPLPAVPAPVDTPAPPAPATPAAPSTPSLPSVPTPPRRRCRRPPSPACRRIDLPPLPGAGGTGGNDRGGSSPLPPLPKLSAKTSSDPQAQTRLLDYLLAP